VEKAKASFEEAKKEAEACQAAAEQAYRTCRKT